MPGSSRSPTQQLIEYLTPLIDTKRSGKRFMATPNRAALINRILRVIKKYYKPVPAYG
jgi:hypothetical protein